MTEIKKLILYVEDGESALPISVRDQAVQISPHQIAEHIDAAETALLWVFDFYYEEDQGVTGVFDENGLSELSKLREGISGPRPFTVVLSGHLERMLKERGVAPIPRRHTQATALGVDWLAEKNDAEEEAVIERIAASLIETSEKLKSRSSLSDLLRIPEKSWAAIAERHIRTARPPSLQKDNSNSGDALQSDAIRSICRDAVTWALHVLFPYPGVLISDAQAAALLEVKLVGFRRWVSDTGKELVDECEYKGILSGHLGRRWWRAGIEDLLWQINDDASFDKGRIAKGLSSDDFTNVSSPVVCHNEELVETEEIVSAEDCVRLAGFDFPSHVDPVWVKQELVLNNRRLTDLVVYDDLYRLEASDEIDRA